VQPRSTAEVALVLKTLTSPSNTQLCQFAIRSGGQGSSGTSNIEGGVTLDLRYINAVEYDAENGYVTVGPGATWDDVFTTLEPLGVMIAGGRSSSVGVGGLTLGGGISYFSAEHGMVCDNVLEFEVLLADGREVIASRMENPDLFTVLKGGGSNFGIVTAFRFRTFEYRGMWGGLNVYPDTTIHAQFRALVNFADKIGENPKGSVIVMVVYKSATGAELVMNMYDYTEPVVRPSEYDEFLAIKPVIADTTGLRNMSSLAQEGEGVTTHRSAKPLHYGSSIDE
jgi:FAD/FMN-containing dehydrogenase